MSPIAPSSSDGAGAPGSLDATIAQQFRDLIEGSIQGIVIHDPAWRPLFANDAYARMFGFATAEEIVALDSIEPLYAPGERERLIGYRDARVRGKSAPQRYEFEGRRRDGTALYLENVVRVVDWHGERAIQVTVVDLTDRRRAEDSLRRYAQIVAASGDLLSLVDDEYRYRAVNQAYLDAHALEEGAIIGRTIADIRGEAYFRDLVKPYADRCLGGEHVSYERWTDFPTGGRRCISVNLYPYREADGRVTGFVTNRRDMTAARLAEDALRKAKERLELIAHTVSDVVWEWDLVTNRMHWIEGQDRLFGYSREEVGDDGDWWITLMHPDDRAAFLAREKEWLEGTRSAWAAEYRLRRADGQYAHVTERARILRDEDGRAIMMVGGTTDVTESRRLSEQLAYHASHDGLTGLLNRREFESRLGRVLGTDATAGEHHALCYLDLDQFKVINDTCGHVAGDALLRQLGGVLGRVVRRNDTLARLGGDEFGVLLENCPIDQALRVASELREAIDGFQFAWEERHFRVAVSIGVVAIPEGGDTLIDALKAADAACYLAKESGRNRIRVYRTDDDQAKRRRGEMRWLARIESALDADRFRIHAQPIFAVGERGARPAQAELLLRMVDEDGSEIAPGAFLPAAERYHLGPRIDRWVIAHAFEFIAACPAGPSLPPLYAINLSGQSLGDPDMREFVLAAFDSSGVDPSRICFEVTETAAIARLADATRLLEALRALGCRVALDDFGSGLSSFAYLKHLPVDYLKIDGAFVSDILTDAADRAMVRSINDIAHVMGKQTVAECVESDAILEALREIGVDYAQGFALGHPKPL